MYSWTCMSCQSCIFLLILWILLSGMLCHWGPYTLLYHVGFRYWRGLSWGSDSLPHCNQDQMTSWALLGPSTSSCTLGCWQHISVPLSTALGRAVLDACNQTIFRWREELYTCTPQTPTGTNGCHQTHQGHTGTVWTLLLEEAYRKVIWISCTVFTLHYLPLETYGLLWQYSQAELLRNKYSVVLCFLLFHSVDKSLRQKSWSQHLSCNPYLNFNFIFEPTSHQQYLHSCLIILPKKLPSASRY